MKKENECRYLSLNVSRYTIRNCPNVKSLNKHRTLDHPFFLGFQAHPEFCTRPLNPSPPFLGFVAAASVEDNLRDQFEFQARHYRPPHSKSSMISEAAMMEAVVGVQKVQDESEVHMNVVQVVNEDI
jgi:CTP synthase